MRIEGKDIARKLIEELKSRPKPEKFFGAILVGDDPASVNFLKQKEKVAKELGIGFELHKLPADIATDDLRREIGRLAGAETCGGFIVQLPLPKHIGARQALDAIPKEKDVDLLSESAIGKFYAERSAIMPPSVAVVEELLKLEPHNLRDLNVAVVGKGILIGKPIAFWFQSRAKSVTIFDSKTEHLREKLKEFDVIVSGVGKPHLFGAEHVANNAFVIDFGYGSREMRNEKGEMREQVVGDFNPAGLEAQSSKLKAISYTPTPGGTGPILVAKLYENFYKLNS